MSTSALLGLSYWQPGTTSPQSYQNDALTRLDLFAANSVKSRSVAAQPGTPAVGDAYILPASPTGTNWATFTAGDLVQAIKDASGTSVTYWVRYAPRTGLPIYVQDTGELIAWNGSAYVQIPVGIVGVHDLADVTATATREINLANGRVQTLFVNDVSDTALTLTLNIAGPAGVHCEAFFYLYFNTGLNKTITPDVGWGDSVGFTDISSNLKTDVYHLIWSGTHGYVMSTRRATGDKRP